MVEVSCPVDGCDRSPSKRAVHLHLQQSHGYPMDEAVELAAEAKRESEAAQRPASEPAARPEAEPEPELEAAGGDEVDQAIAELIRRRVQREKLETVGQLQEERPETSRSPLEDVEKVVSLIETVQGLGPDPAPQAVADGAGPATESDVLAALASNDVDPETAEVIAERVGGSDRGAMDRLVDELLQNAAFRTVSEAVSEVGANQLAEYLTGVLEGRRASDARGVGPRAERAAAADAESVADDRLQSPGKRRREGDRQAGRETVQPPDGGEASE